MNRGIFHILMRSHALIESPVYSLRTYMLSNPQMASRQRQISRCRLVFVLQRSEICRARETAPSAPWHSLYIISREGPPTLT